MGPKNVEMFRQNFQEVQVDIYVSIPSFSLKKSKKSSKLLNVALFLCEILIDL
jgi:hypothetical protein